MRMDVTLILVDFVLMLLSTNITLIPLLQLMCLAPLDAAVSMTLGVEIVWLVVQAGDWVVSLLWMALVLHIVFSS